MAGKKRLLTDEAINEITRAYWDARGTKKAAPPGWAQEMAKRYGVSPYTIKAILEGRYRP